MYGCLLVFSLLFALRLDGIIEWNYWIVFLPLWIWKALVVGGATVGSCIWWRNPNYRSVAESTVPYVILVSYKQYMQVNENVCIFLCIVEALGHRTELNWWIGD